MRVKCPVCSEVIEIGNTEESVVTVVCSGCGKSLKLKLRQKTETPGPDKKSAEAPEKKKKILVADDTAFFRTMLSDLLQSKGYTVLTAGDGEEALKIIKHELPDLDLVLLDLLMPKMTGFDVLKETRKGVLGKNLKMLAMTGIYSKPEDIAHLRDCGADGYIKKSNDMDDILFRVEQALSQKE